MHILHDVRGPVEGGGLGADLCLLELMEARQVSLHNSFIVPESSTGARIILLGRVITLREGDIGVSCGLSHERQRPNYFKDLWPQSPEFKIVFVLLELQNAKCKQNL